MRGRPAGRSIDLVRQEAPLSDRHPHNHGAGSCRSTTVRKAESIVDHIERLRRLALNDPSVVEAQSDAPVGPAGTGPLEPREVALAQLAALIAIGGAVPSYGALADAAVGSGVTVAQVVDVLTAVMPIVGVPRVVEAAPKLALALGYDTGEAFEPDR
jgi:4-carboxymuconolactone decarboxylase